jgi:hypothetical protein
MLACERYIRQVILSLIDTILIQERPGVFCYLLTYISFHNLSNDHAYGAALVKLSLVKICQAVNCSLSNYITAIDLFTVHGVYRFSSFYF